MQQQFRLTRREAPDEDGQLSGTLHRRSCRSPSGKNRPGKPVAAEPCIVGRLDSANFPTGDMATLSAIARS